MAKFYFHDTKRLLSTGNCPDGFEELQPKPSKDAVLVIGEPPCSSADIGERQYWSMELNKVVTIEKTTEELWLDVRYLRDRLLASTDWRMLRAAETDEPVSSDWLDYRQALRDITNQSDPSAIVWPTPPEN